jgi:hypothetical protein
MQSSSKLQLFMETENSVLKFIWKHKRLQVAKAILRQRSNGGSSIIPDFKLFYKAISIKNSVILAQKLT